VDQIVVPLTIVVAVVALLVSTALLFTVRRVVLSRRGASFDCSLRRPDGSWTLGVARYGDDRLHWFRVFSLSVRPRLTWLRDELAVVVRRPSRGTEVTAVLPHAVVVECRYAGEDLDLAMSDDAYTGLASWLEAAPPGRNVHVT
jgi:Protein of unknown function (DUF2550)